MLAGILLGDESGISEKVDRAFRDTGTSHIIVISGFNITIIVGLLVGVFNRIFGGGQFGVRRAAIMGGTAVFTSLGSTPWPWWRLIWQPSTHRSCGISASSSHLPHPWDWFCMQNRSKELLKDWPRATYRLIRLKNGRLRLVIRCVIFILPPRHSPQEATIGNQRYAVIFQDLKALGSLK